MKHFQLLRIVVATLMLAGLTGCFSSRDKDIKAFVKPHQTDVTAKNYIMQPADEVTVFCSKIPEFGAITPSGQTSSASQATQRIRPDGKVSFESFGEIEAAGKTPAQLAEVLRQKAATLYSLSGDYPIDVRVTVSRSKVFYVVGEVRDPGPRVYTGRDNALTAVSTANPLVTAWVTRIQVIRPSADKETKPSIFEINLKKMIVHGDTSKNVLLEEGDIVYVPPTVLAALGQVIAEFVRPIGEALSPAASVYAVSQMGSGGGN